MLNFEQWYYSYYQKAYVSDEAEASCIAEYREYIRESMNKFKYLDKGVWKHKEKQIVFVLKDEHLQFIQNEGSMDKDDIASLKNILVNFLDGKGF